MAGAAFHALAVVALVRSSGAQSPMFTVVSGQEYCELSDGGRCVTDGPNGYHSDEACTIAVTRSGTISSEGDFDVEYSASCAYDFIQIGSQKFCSDDGPHLVPVDADETFTWTSDTGINRMGWTVCLTPQSSTLAPTASPSASGTRSCAQLGWEPRHRTPLVCAESEINGICHEDKTYPEAQAICSYVGARLCTESELDDDVGRGSGCRDDGDKVWTSSTCGDAGGFTAMSSGSRPSRECAIPTRTSHQVKCCADVVTAHPTAHPTAAPSSAVPTTLAPTLGPTAPPTCAGFSEVHPHGRCRDEPSASSWLQIDEVLPAACQMLCAENRTCVAFETHEDEDQARECILFSGTAPTSTDRSGSRECYVKEPACFSTTAAPVMSTSAPPSGAPTAQPTVSFYAVGTNDRCVFFGDSDGNHGLLRAECWNGNRNGNCGMATIGACAAGCARADGCTHFSSQATPAAQGQCILCLQEPTSFWANSTAYAMGTPTAPMPTTRPPTTVAPTAAPTAAPTSAPSTLAPTVPPTTMQPTVPGETHGPTRGPTRGPTVAPTSIPTVGGAPSTAGTLDAGNTDAGGSDGGGGGENDVGDGGGAQLAISIVVSAAITATCGAYVVHVRKRQKDRLRDPGNAAAWKDRLRDPPNAATLNLAYRGQAAATAEAFDPIGNTYEPMYAPVDEPAPAAGESSLNRSVAKGGSGRHVHGAEPIYSDINDDGPNDRGQPMYAAVAEAPIYTAIAEGEGCAVQIETSGAPRPLGIVASQSIPGAPLRRAGDGDSLDNLVPDYKDGYISVSCEVDAAHAAPATGSEGLYEVPVPIDPAAQDGYLAPELISADNATYEVPVSGNDAVYGTPQDSASHGAAPDRGGAPVAPPRSMVFAATTAGGATHESAV